MAVALLGAAIFCIALVIAAGVLGLRAAVRRPGTTDGKLPLRRCDACGRGWRAQPGREISVIGLRLRRRVRRRLRSRDPDRKPRWAAPQGWSRCPSCLSTRVRMSGEDPTPESWTTLEKAGVAVGIVGVAVLAVAAIGVLW